MKKVYLCIDFNTYTTDDVKEELLEQRDECDWICGNNLERISECDEFWEFGNCSDLEAHKKALELGKDIWQMK